MLTINVSPRFLHNAGSQEKIESYYMSAIEKDCSVINVFH